MTAVAGSGQAPIWRDVVGQAETIATLERAVADPAAMTHAWLFTGPPGSGRSTAARAFAGALLCPTGGCGECRECRTALDGTHADVDVLALRDVEHLGDDLRGILEVGVDRHHPGAERAREAGAHGGLVACVRAQPHDTDLRPLAAQSLQDGGGVVR